MASLAQRRPPLWLSLTGLMTATGLAALDNFIVNPALPRIVGEFGGLAHLPWVLTAFMLTSTISMPLYGKFSDIYGRRALFTVSIVIFVLGSALCGSARSMLGLILFRGLQGAGAGGAVVLAMTCLGDIVSPRDRPRYQGLFNATFALASIAGPVIGGIVTSAFGWRWVFYINLPLGLLALFLIWISIPGRLGEHKSHRIDYGGVGLLVLGTVSFLMLVQRAEHVDLLLTATSALLAVLALVAFGVLVPHERRAAEPILAVHLLGNKIFVRTVVASAAIGCGFFGSTVFFPLYFQMVGGHSPAESGLLLLPQLLSGTAMSIIGGQFVARTGHYKAFIIVGILLVSLAFLLFAVIAWLGPNDLLTMGCLAMMGAGGGLCMPNMTVALQNAIEPRDLGVGTSSMQFCNQLAAVAGVALSGLLLSQRARSYASERLSGTVVEHVLGGGTQLLSHLSPAEHEVIVATYRHAFAGTFLTSAAVCFVALLFAVRIPVMALRGRAPSDELIEGIVP
jgi:EmrB/QacA subfamily drug resistance transporter